MLSQLQTQREITDQQLDAQRALTITQLEAQREIIERQITASVRTQSRMAWIDKVRSHVADIQQWAIVSGVTYVEKLQLQETPGASATSVAEGVRKNADAQERFRIAYHSLGPLLDVDQPEERALADAAPALVRVLASAPKTVGETSPWRDSTGPLRRAVHDAAIKALKVHHTAAILGN